MKGSRNRNSEQEAIRPMPATSTRSEPNGSTSHAVIPRSLQIGVGIVLTAVAGFVDAVGFIELGGFFASFMSGASISLGVSASGTDWVAMYHATVLIAVFVIAATIASVISGVMRPLGVATAILLEAACLTGAILMIESGWSSSDSVVPVVAAMGIQNTALRPISGIRLGVTFMTGTLVSLSQALGRLLIGRARSWSWAPHALIWFLFVAGAVAGAVLHRKYGFIAIAVPTLVVWALGAFTFIAALVEIRKQKRLEGVAT